MSRKDFIAGYRAGKSAQWYLDDAFVSEPDDYASLCAPSSFFAQHADGYSRGGGWWQSRVFFNGWEADVFDDYSWQVVDSDGNVLVCSYQPNHPLNDDPSLFDGENFQDAVDKANAYVFSHAGAIALRKASFDDDMDYVSEIPYNQCVICTFGPDEYGRGDWGYDIYLKSGDWISSNIVEFQTEDAAIDDAMDRLDSTGFENVSRGIVVAGCNAKRSARKCSFPLGARIF